MSESPIMTIDDVDIDFENLSTKVTALQNIQELNVEKGNELETSYWIASQLVRSGLATFHEDGLLNFNTLYKIHWKETKLQTGRRITSLPEYFYPKLRRYLQSLKQKASTDATRSGEYHNALRLAHDIVNCRLKKLVSLSTSSTQTESLLQKLSVEERILFEQLQSIVSEWMSKILKVGSPR